MSYDYSENILVQESAGHLLADELGWQVELAYNQEILGANGTFGRSSYKDILLARYFHKALRTLNPWITDDQVIEAQNTFEKHLSSASLMQINEEKYAYIRDGIPVTEKKPNGQTEEKRAMIIDFQHPDDMERNHFLAVKEMKIHGDLYRRRTDIVGFVNGIPLLFVELKKNSVDVQNAYTDNYTDYLDTIPQLFYYNAFLMLSNGVEAKVGTLGSKYEFFHEWKRLSEQEQGSVALETMLRGICKKENFLDLLENFILYDHSGGKTVKILARNHQYLGVNEAVKAYEARKLNNGKLGVFWHTQGSGKSYSMVFLSQKIRRKFAGSPTIVVLTDREELNSQISDTFENCGLLGKTKASKFIATSGEDLISKLKGNPSFIFTLIQKFNKKVDEPIIPDHDIIIMMKYLDRDDISKADRERKDAIIAIFDELKKKKKHVDNTDLMVQINGILGDYIMIERTPDDRGFAKRFDISKIDFDLLRREFARIKKKNLAFMDLDELIQVRLDAMIRENPRRVDYYIRYQQIIEEYNSEQDRVNIEKTFMELMDLANSMNEEEQRYVREGFSSDEELSMYDMLFDVNLSKEDIKNIKKVAVDLLDKIKAKIAELDHWTDKQETKAEVDNLIGKILWEELPESYSDQRIFEYRKLIFEYVFMRYKQVA